jgi:hypothetical protein
MDMSGVYYHLPHDRTHSFPCVRFLFARSVALETKDKTPNEKSEVEITYAGGRGRLHVDQSRPAIK